MCEASHSMWTCRSSVNLKLRLNRGHRAFAGSVFDAWMSLMVHEEEMLQHDSTVDP